MHMADALLSPVVGGVGWAASLGLSGYSARKLRKGSEGANVPLMGVAAAFVFAAQMLNFTIPGTGSSGHLGGGLILTALLGPHGAFLAMASILTVQALVFADGGLLALGCNIVNLGLFPCLIAYPLLFRPLVGQRVDRARLTMASMVTAIVGLQLGALGVALETVFSGISALPFGTFVCLMQPIHLAIGVVEGLATSAVLLSVWQARPSVVDFAKAATPADVKTARHLVVALAAGAVLMGGVVSWFASAHPDGLEWSMAKTSGAEELPSPPDRAHHFAESLQRRLALLPDYGFAESDAKATSEVAEVVESWPAVSAGTSVSGILGSAVTVLVAGLIALVLRGKKEGEGSAS